MGMDWKQEIADIIKDYVKIYESESGTAMRWMPPLVGFANAFAPEFKELKSIVHSEHALPQDILPEASIVVSYFLPYPREIAESNRITEDLASFEWAMAYRETNLLFIKLNEHMVSELAKRDVKAALPLARASMDGETLTSRWSQRHVARIAGLGTFGLNNMLITQRGCCGRFSSFVTDLATSADLPLTEPACLYRRDGSCGVCIGRCHAHALTETGFDRFLCAKVCADNQRYHDPGQKYGTDSEVCGKCLIDLPCSF